MKVSYDLKFEKFLDLWSKAEKRKDKKAQYKLALLYFKHNQPDTSVYAFQLFKNSAKQGFTDAAYMVARCYHEGLGIRKNYRLAIKWYIETDSYITHDIWNNPSKVDKKENEFLKKYFENDKFADKIDEELDIREKQMSIDNIISTALSGNSDAQNRLGYYYYNGNEFEKDIQEAIFWYEKAAAQGNDAAMERLAEHYNKTGQYKESAEWYRKYTEERIKWRNKRLNW